MAIAPPSAPVGDPDRGADGSEGRLVEAVDGAGSGVWEPVPIAVDGFVVDWQLTVATAERL